MKNIFHNQVWLGSVITIIRTLLSYSMGILICFIFWPPLLVLLLLPDRYRYENRWLFWLLDLFYRSIVMATFVPVRVAGKEHMPNSPAIIIANHQSALDIPLVGSTLNAYPHTWYVLSYYLRYPFLGWFIRRMCISLNRDNPSQVAQEFIRGIKLIEGRNRHIIIFPEGARFVDGQVHRFLSGFAVIARTTNRPVVPLFIKDSGKVYPPGTFLIHQFPITVDIGEPFIYEEGETDSQFTERVYQWFVSKS